jgi:DNA-binding transcriptional MerR regulator
MVQSRRSSTRSKKGKKSTAGKSPGSTRKKNRKSAGKPAAGPPPSDESSAGGSEQVSSSLEIHAAEVAALLPPDGKIYYRIGEVSRITGVKPYVLRYWESEFRWMSPHKSRSKQRLYRRRDIEMILLIRRLLHQERYTIAGARKRLSDLGVGRILEESAEAREAHPARPQTLLTADPSDREFYRQIRNELVAIRDMI